MRIAAVIPTNSEERLANFSVDWSDLFKKHAVTSFAVLDGDIPHIEVSRGSGINSTTWKDPKFAALISHHTDAVRNAGFVEAIKSGADIIITLDDDVRPDGNDPIQEHLDALAGNYPTSWFNPFDGAFMRGFPYGVRTESRAVVSHGVWSGIQDFDAPTTLVRGTAPAKNAYRGAIPKGCLTPISGMNLAFRREVAPLVYFAPMAGDTGYNRFADIWMGIHLKRTLDARGLALVHGFSTVRHDRQSNPVDNLVAEAEGILENEGYWQGYRDGKYEKEYAQKREQWRKLMEEIL